MKQNTVTKNEACFILREMGMKDEASDLRYSDKYNAAIITVHPIFNDKYTPLIGTHAKIDWIVNEVCKSEAITKELLTVKTRKREVADARKMIAYLAWIYTDASLNRIASYTGHSDHSSVIHARNEGHGMVDKQFRRTVTNLENIISLRLKKERSLTT